MNPVDDAIAIWKAGVAAVDPRKLVRDLFLDGHPLTDGAVRSAKTIRVVGGGKAGSAMARGLESALGVHRGRVTGIVNVPEGMTHECGRIALHEARPPGSNFPTQAGVDGVRQMLDLVADAGPDDLVVVLLSGGGSALLPAPVEGVTLAEKLDVTRQLHRSGATIAEMNCVRKHLSRIKGGRLAEALKCPAFALIISDVVGDPLDVIASGPTVPDPTTYSEALSILEGCDVPASVRNHLERGRRGEIPETPKREFPTITNLVIGSNALARVASSSEAERLGHDVDFLREDIVGEAREAARTMAERVRRSRATAFLFGGETTVALGPNPGKGGRNQEFVLAMLCELGEAGMKGVTILSGGTDGEDGPTDAAGAIGTLETLKRAIAMNLDPKDFLDRHDAYHFFEKTGGLFKTGLTGTNVMDLGVILLARRASEG